GLADGLLDETRQAFPFAQDTFGRAAQFGINPQGRNGRGFHLGTSCIAFAMQYGASSTSPQAKRTASRRTSTFPARRHSAGSPDSPASAPITIPAIAPVVSASPPRFTTSVSTAAKPSLLSMAWQTARIVSTM